MIFSFLSSFLLSFFVFILFIQSNLIPIQSNPPAVLSGSSIRAHNSPSSHRRLHTFVRPPASAHSSSSPPPPPLPPTTTTASLGLCSNTSRRPFSASPPASIASSWVLEGCGVASEDAALPVSPVPVVAGDGAAAAACCVCVGVWVCGSFREGAARQANTNTKALTAILGIYFVYDTSTHSKDKKNTHTHTHTHTRHGKKRGTDFFFFFWPVRGVTAYKNDGNIIVIIYGSWRSHQSRDSISKRFQTFVFLLKDAA